MESHNRSATAAVSELCYSCGRRIVNGVQQCGCEVTTERSKLDRKLEASRKAWYKLHRYAITVPYWSPESASRWFVQWEDTEIPRACKCPADWKKRTKARKPKFNSREEFFKWTVDIHNDVNCDLGKPFVSLAEAWMLYAYSRQGPILPRVVEVYNRECIVTGDALEATTKPVRADVVIPFCEVDSIYLREAVESILQQQNAEPLIHVVADGCEFPRLPLAPNLRLYKTEGGCGPYRITNALFPYFKTDYLAIQDADDISVVNRLSKQIGTLEALGYDMISGRMIQFVADDCQNDARMQGLCSGMPYIYSGMRWDYSPRGVMINSVKTMRMDLFKRLGGFADWLMSADHEWDIRCTHDSDALLFHATDIFGYRRLHNRSLSNGVFPLHSEQRKVYTDKLFKHIHRLTSGDSPASMGGGLGKPILVSVS